MGRTPDRTPGEADEEGILWEEITSDPTSERQLRFVQNKGLVVFTDGVLRSIGETRHTVWQSEVDDESINTPPGSPTVGYRVIVGDSPTGAYVGHAGEIAQWTGSAWIFITPRKGFAAYVKSRDSDIYQTAETPPWTWKVGGGYPPAFDTLYDETVDTTTLSTWIEKISLTTPDLELGSYIVFAQSIISGSKSNTRFSVRAQWDDTDNFGLLNSIASIDDAEYQFFTHTIKATTSGIHTIDIDFNKNAGSGYVSIKEARVTYWRVSDG